MIAEIEFRPAIRVKIANEGHTARILMVKSVNDGYIFQAESKPPPFYLKNGDETDLRFYLSKEFKSDPGKLLVNVIYSDSLQFFYVATFVGDKDRIDMQPDRLLTPQEIKNYGL